MATLKQKGDLAELMVATDLRRRGYRAPAAELGEGMSMLTLRMTPARNQQRRGIRLTADYLALPS